MSSDIIRKSMVVLNAGIAELVVYAYATNVSPKPTYRELVRGDSHRIVVGRVALDDPTKAREELESLARVYAGGCFKENSQWITGMQAYGLWVKRIRKEAPGFTVLPARASRVNYGNSERLKERKFVPGLRVGDELTVDTAKMLCAAGVFPRLKVQSWGEKTGVFLAFVKDHTIYYAAKRGARFGYSAYRPVVDEPIAERVACAALRTDRPSGDDAFSVALLEPDGEKWFMHNNGDFAPAGCIRNSFSYMGEKLLEKVDRMSFADAEVFCGRMKEVAPNEQWTVIPASDAESAIMLAVLVAA